MIGDPYADRDELKNRFGLEVSDTADDDALDDALLSASQEVNNHTGRQFNNAGTATPRVFRPRSPLVLPVDDFHTADGLIVETDENDDGVFETQWDPIDYELDPLNGVVGGVPGWPYWTIRAVRWRRWPCARRATARVTAPWGWATVPPPVKDATLILAAETFKLREAPFGVAGFGEYGAVRVRDNPKAAKKLAPYVLDPVLMR